MDVPFHLARPLQKPPQMDPLAPYEFPKLQKPDLCHLYAGISLDAPQEIGAPPRSQAMVFGRVPEKAECIAHEIGLPQVDAVRRSFQLLASGETTELARTA